jgi:ribosomal protein L32
LLQSSEQALAAVNLIQCRISGGGVLANGICLVCKPYDKKKLHTLLI